MEEMDEDQSGEVDFDEFYEWFKLANGDDDEIESGERKRGYVGSQLGKATVTWAKEQQRHVQKHAATEEKRRLVAQAKKNLVIPNSDKIEAVSSQQRSATTTATAVVV